MADRPLGPDEAALWARVLATVRPLPGRAAPPSSKVPVPLVKMAPTPVPLERPHERPGSPPRSHHSATLDAGWDKRLARGIAQPDCVVDLHGHTLGTAYARLDAALDQAIAEGDRVMLLVTGKPPRPESERPHARGAIRDAVGDWLAASRHAGSIAAVRNAHPRHGGQGALYVILRRKRGPG